MNDFRIHKVTAEDLMSGTIAGIISKDDAIQLPLTISRSAILHCILRAPKISLMDQNYFVKSQDSFALYLNGGWHSSLSIVKPIIHTAYETTDTKEVYARLLPWFYCYEAAQVNQMIHRNQIEIFKADIDCMQGGNKNGGTR